MSVRLPGCGSGRWRVGSGGGSGQVADRSVRFRVGSGKRVGSGTGRFRNGSAQVTGRQVTGRLRNGSAQVRVGGCGSAQGTVGEVAGR